MGLFRPSGDDELANAADGGAVTTNDLKAAGGLGGLMGALGGLGQMGPAIDRVALAFQMQADLLAAILRAVHRAEVARQPLVWASDGARVVLPEGDWQTLAIVNAGATALSVQLDGDPVSFPVAAAAGGVPAVAYVPLAGVRSVSVSGQTAAVYGVALTQSWR